MDTGCAPTTRPTTATTPNFSAVCATAPLGCVVGTLPLANTGSESVKLGRGVTVWTDGRAVRGERECPSAHFG